MNDESYLNIYAQAFHHDDALIVGNRAALIRLEKLIKTALEEDVNDREYKDEFFANDGEGYSLSVKVVNEINELHTHYTDYI